MIAIPHVAVVVVGILACVSDVRTRRIPNRLTMSAASIALVFHVCSSGWQGLLLSSSGLGIGLLMFLPLFALRAMGAGDVKLLAALGAWIGPELVAWTALYGIFAGGALALLVALNHRYLRRALANIWSLLVYWALTGIKPMPALTLADAPGPRLAYAVPISIGAMVTLWLRS